MIRVIELIVSVSFYIEILKKVFGLFLKGYGLEKSKDDSARNESNILVTHVELVTVLYLFLKNILGQKVALSPLVLYAFQQIQPSHKYLQDQRIHQNRDATLQYLNITIDINVS